MSKHKIHECKIQDISTSFSMNQQKGRMMMKVENFYDFLAIFRLTTLGVGPSQAWLVSLV